MSCDREVWEWLPARTDTRRVTLPSTIAVALNLPVPEVSTALARMEQAGQVVRNNAVGRQTGWHRGKPLAELSTLSVPAEDELRLY